MTSTSGSTEPLSGYACGNGAMFLRAENGGFGEFLALCTFF